MRPGVIYYRQECNHLKSKNREVLGPNNVQNQSYWGEQMVFKKQEKTCQMSAWKCEGYKTNDLQETENLLIFSAQTPMS